MNKMERNIIRHSANARPREYWANVINAKWQEQVPTIIQTGKRLEEANAELPSKEWKTLLKEDLNISKGTASKLIAISQSDTASEVSYMKLLPANWGTLYLLTFLDADTFAAAVADGRINPKMQQKDAKALRGDDETSPKRKKKDEPLDLMGVCAKFAREVTYATDGLPKEQRAEFFASIRGIVEALEKEDSDD